MADLRTVIAKLNIDNYVLWKYRMELLLRKEKLWDAIEKPAPANPDAAQMNSERYRCKHSNWSISGGFRSFPYQSVQSS